MSEITVRLVFNLNTGKKDIYVDYESDSDALPIEHERRHREIVEELLGKGLLQPGEAGDVKAGVAKVGRVEPDASDAAAEDAERRRRAQDADESSSAGGPQAQGQGA